MAPRHIALMALLALCALMVVGQLYVTIPLTADLAARHALPPAQATLAGTAFGIAYALGFLVLGPLSDRLGRRRVLVGGLLATAAATALVGLAGSFAWLLAARALQGFVAAAVPPTALSLVTETLPPRQRPWGISVMSLAFLSAAPLAQVFGAAVAPAGLPTIMLSMAPAFVLGAVGLAVIVAPPTAAVPTGPSAGSHDADPTPSILRDRQILAAWAAAATVLFGFVSFFAGLAALGPAVSADLDTLRLATLPPLVMVFAAAAIARRAGPPVAAALGVTAAAVGLALAGIGTGAWMLAGGVVLAAGVAIAVPGLIGTIAARAAPANRAFALAVYTFVLFVGASAAPPVAQALAAQGVLAVVLPPAGLMAVAAVMLLLARTPR